MNSISTAIRRVPDWVLDLFISVLGLTAFISVLTAFSGNYIDDENVFHAVVMFCIFFLEGVSSILDTSGVWHSLLDTRAVQFLHTTESFAGTFFAVLSSSLAAGFYVKRWEMVCELNRGRGNIQKCGCLVASIVLGFLSAAALFLKGYLFIKRLRSTNLPVLRLSADNPD